MEFWVPLWSRHTEKNWQNWITIRDGTILKCGNGSAPDVDLATLPISGGKIVQQSQISNYFFIYIAVCLLFTFSVLEKKYTFCYINK